MIPRACTEVKKTAAAILQRVKDVWKRISQVFGDT